MEPQSKRIKSECDIDSWFAYPVLSNFHTHDAELIEAFAAPIVNKKETSRLIKELATVYPLPGLTHMRVRACKDKGNPHPLEIIVCLASDAPDFDCSKDMHISDLPSSGRINCGGLGNLFLVKTPACPPLTRSKFEQARKHWPTYYEDKQLTVALKGQLFTSMKAKMQDYMMAAVAAARAGQERGMEAVGAAVVEPEAVRIVAVGHDCWKGVHPLNHTVMVCIDLVARGQHGGAYTHDKYPACQFVLPDSSPSEIHGATTMPTCGVLRDKDSAEESGQPYICTGNNLYVTEPCNICAMLLGAVFYGTASTDGAFGTKYKIDAQKYQTHRFEVFQGVLGQQYQN
ncbi:LOW QUALITY PROTEIN: putative inactive tRNA-specific adenosine deaminase-like protein 3 [Salvelinus alpinus]